jgi:2-methylcitrate dehydratase PrpD
MTTQMMIDAVCDEIKQKLNDFCSHADLEHLTPEVAEEMSRALSDALAAAGVDERERVYDALLKNAA